MSFKIFCDLDGVLTDFNRGVWELTGREPEDYNTRTDDAWMWRAIAKAPGFYATLPLKPDGLYLWQYLMHLDGDPPVILTGLPTSVNAEEDKRAWVRRELGPSVQVVCCRSRDKILHGMIMCRPDQDPLLIDDMRKFRSIWEEAGGTFILHTSAEDTIAQLKAKGL